MDKIQAVVIFLLVLVLYLPTLSTGFLTDDFLDCTHTLQEVPAAFSSQYVGGYRPLMILSWALDNRIWSVENQTGRHILARGVHDSYAMLGDPTGSLSYRD